MPKDYAAVVASLRGRKPSSDDRFLIGGQDVSDVLAVSTALAAQPPEPPEPEKQIIDPRALVIGQVIEGKGVYQGTWSPKARILSKVFDLYAAPEDIKYGSGDNLLMTFNDAVSYVAGMRNWHGHDGGNFKNDEAVILAVDNNPESLGNWFIPTKEMLHGKDANGAEFQDNHLYGNREKMPSGGEYVCVNSNYYDKTKNAHCYWSCTENRQHKTHVYYLGFEYGVDSWDPKGTTIQSTRLVRAELRL